MARQSLLSVVLGLKSDKFERGLTSAQRKLKATSTQLSNVGRGLTIGLTAPLAAIGASSFKVAADFELAMKKVKAVSGATGKEFDKLNQSALDLGASTVFSASSVSSLQLEMAKLGLSADEIVKATDSTLSLAQAFGNELGPTAETVVKTINQFGLEAEDASHVADVMATAFGSSALDLEKFGGAMGNVAPVAKEFGFSLEETTALLGVLANNGIEGTDAGTKLKMAFSQLAAEGVNVKQVFGQIINGSLSYKDAVDLLGKRAAILSPILGKNRDDLADLGLELKTSEGRAKAMSAEMDDSAKGGIASMRSAIEGAQIQIGNALAPVVLEIIEKVKNMAQAFGAMSTEAQRTTIKIVAFVAALGPLLSIGGGITRMALNVSKGFTMLAGKGFVASMRFKRLAVVLRTLFRVVSNNPIGVFLKVIAAVGTMAIPFIANMGKMTEEQRKFTEKTRKANLELARQQGLLRTALKLNIDVASVSELRSAIGQITNQLDAFNSKAVSSDVKVKLLERGGFQITDLGSASKKLSGILQKELGTNLQQQINVLTSQAMSKGLFGDDAIAFVEQNLQKVVDATVSEYRQGLEAKRGEFQSALDEALKPDEGDGSSLELDGLLKNVPKTLADVKKELKKELADITELEILFGENLDAEKFKVIESAIREIVQADFANADETLGLLVQQMGEFAEVTESTAEQIKGEFKTALEELQVSKGLGIISDLELAQQALTALETMLVNSILTDPDFINSEAFTELNARMLEFQNILAGTQTQQDATNEKLFEAADAGQAATSVLNAGFSSLTDSTQTFGEAITQVFGNLIKSLLSTAIANAITAAFSPASPDNIITGGAAAPIKATALKASVASLFASIPKLHDGGMTLGPQLALIGDNPSGREAVIPMEKMGSFLGQVAGTNQNMNVTGRIHGSDILLAQERAKRNRGR